MRKDARKLDSSMAFDGNALLAALDQPPNPKLVKELDSKLASDQEKSRSEAIFATCKHDVIFAVRYHYLNLICERKPDVEDPNVFMRPFPRPPKAGTIKSAKMGEVVLGKGIMLDASAYVK